MVMGGVRLQSDQIGQLLGLWASFKGFGNNSFAPFLGNFCEGVKIYHFSSDIIFGQLLKTFGNFFWSHGEVMK